MLNPFTRLFATNTRTGIKRGLEEFFEAGGSWVWTKEDLKGGRPWTAPQLRTKSFHDLHCLWWICIRELNKLHSQKFEADRFRVLFPHTDRVTSVKITMARIKQVLGERKLSFEKANEIYEREREKSRLVKEYLSKNGADSEEILLEETDDVPEDVMKEINVKVMKTIPAPTLGLTASAVAIGMKPYAEEIVELPKFRKMRKEKKEAETNKKHNATHFIL